MKGKAKGSESTDSTGTPATAANESNDNTNVNSGGSTRRSGVPMKQRSNMSNWKSGFEFQQKIAAKKKAATTSRYNNRMSYDPKKKGTFQQRVKGEDAPHLMSVVNAKPEIKKKATEQVAERAKKKEEKLRKMKARVIVNKPSPKQARAIWTSVLSKRSEERQFESGKSQPKKKASSFRLPESSKKPEKKKAASFQLPSTTKFPDWKTAYQDIVSPSSGKPKMIAKQDLAHENKILSPKKKTRNSPPKPGLPSIVLSEDDDDEPQPDSVLERPVVPIAVSGDRPGGRAVTPPPRNSADGRRPEQVSQETPDDLDDFVDLESVQSSLDQDTTEKNSAEPKVKPQLILEFALPTEDGEENDEEAGLQVPVEIQSFDDLSSVGSWPSIESNDSYDTRMNKMMQRWMDLHDGYQDEDRTMYCNDVDLEDNVLDHVVLAACDLDAAMLQFENMTGIKPTPVGPLQGLGAKTAHVGLDDNRYLEILAPDMENPGPLGDELATLKPGTLTPYHYSIRSSEVSRLIEGYVYDVLGWDPDHIAMVQALPDGSIRQWDLLTMYGHDVGGVAPCYVKWKDPAQHPTATIALKATLTKCTVRAPEFHDVHKLITGVGGINVEYGKPLLEVILNTPKGPLTFSTPNPQGLVFPGYDD